jgi:hypothetical protein
VPADAGALQLPTDRVWWEPGLQARGDAWVPLQKRGFKLLEKFCIHEKVL